MNILITGATGFFGLNLTRVLASTPSTQVVATDIRQPTDEQKRFLQEVAGQVEFRQLDILDRSAILELLQQQQISHVVHAAALTPTLEKEQARPTKIVDINLGGTINLLDAVIQTPSIQRVINVSSSGVYGNSATAAGATQLEEGPLQLDHLYSITKHSAELLTQRYSQLSGISMSSVRLAPLYGPLERPSPSRPRISAVGRLMDALLNEKSIRVAGPSVQRDWTYMVDAANAVMALLQSAKLNHAVYNVSCGVAVSWQQVVESFVAQGLSATWSDDAASADIAMRPEQERLAMDISRLQGDTDFVPLYGIDAGIARYLDAEMQL